jgi:hypothetical protein
MRNTLIAFWSGDFPLGQAFCHYAIAYGTIANILATAAAIAAVLAGLPDVSPSVSISFRFPTSLWLSSAFGAAPTNTERTRRGPASPKRR